MQPICIDEKGVLNPGLVVFAVSYGQPAVLVEVTWPKENFYTMTFTLEKTPYDRTPHGTCRYPFLTQMLSYRKNIRERRRGQIIKMKK